MTTNCPCGDSKAASLAYCVARLLGALFGALVSLLTAFRLLGWL